MENFATWFRGLKGKLLFLAVLPVITLGAVSFVAVNGISDLSQNIEDAGSVRAPAIRAIGQMDSARNAVFRWMWASYTNDIDVAARTKTLDAVRNEIKRFGESQKIYAELPKSERAAQSFKVIEDSWTKALGPIGELQRLLEKGDPATKKIEYTIMTQQLRPYLEPMAVAFVDLRTLTEEQIKENLAASRKNSKMIRQLTLGLSVGASIVLFLISIVIASRLAKNLTSLTSRLADAGSQVGTASTQLSSASQQLSSGATEAAASLEETVSSIEELSSMVKLNSEHANEAATLSQTGRKAAEEGEQEMKQLTSAMSDITQSSKRIEEIINVIDDIAFQTNILALNAAVEAARAGEQGKGFAVVAEAVRTLAQRSGAAAKEISGLIKDSVQKVEHGSKVADRSGSALNAIVTSIKKVAELNNEIASASQEQASGLSQISKAMNQLDQATQGNAASAEEAAASSEEMAAQAQALKSVMTELSSVVYGGEGGTAAQASSSFSEKLTSTAIHPKKTGEKHSGIVAFASKKGHLKRVGEPYGNGQFENGKSGSEKGNGTDESSDNDQNGSGDIAANF